MYYQAQRRTLTKQLLHLTDTQLRWELRTLLYLAVVTNRSVIIPNILGNELQNAVQLYDSMALWPGFRVAYIKKSFFAEEWQRHGRGLQHILEPSFYWRIARDYNIIASTATTSSSSGDDDAAFNRNSEYIVTSKKRSSNNNNNNIRRGSSSNNDNIVTSSSNIATTTISNSNNIGYIPSPVVVLIENSSHTSVKDIEDIILSPLYHSLPRLVLHCLPGPINSRKNKKSDSISISNRNHLKVTSSSNSNDDDGDDVVRMRVSKWATDSVGRYETYAVESARYGQLPKLQASTYSVSLRGDKLDELSATTITMRRQQQQQHQQDHQLVRHPVAAQSIVQNVRLCSRLMNPNLGNRSCFDKCD